MSAGDNEAYWVERHERLSHQLRAVGDLGSTEQENLELYARKKRRVVSLLRDLGGVDLKGREVLDVGCGVGMLAELFDALGAEVSGVDASPVAIEEARHRCPGGELVVGSLLDFDLGRRFELAFCVDVLYHVVDDDNWRAALQNVCRHVRPGGLVAILDQLKPEPQSPAPHVRFRTREMYARALSGLGATEATPPGDGVFLVYRV
jgi:2-polyprenyl-3-methyl-5-hydroxy-6-metoxy-1,4-benzoquinol methylase